MYLKILSTFFDKDSSSFFRKTKDGLQKKRSDKWDEYNSQYSKKTLYVKYHGKEPSENELKSSIINLTSSTSCFLSLKAKFGDEYLSKDNPIGFDKDTLKSNILKNLWTSTGLDNYNNYSISLLLPILKELGAEYNEGRIKYSISLIKTNLEMDANNEKDISKLIGKITEDKSFGGIALKGYPPNTFLTYWSLKSLKSFGMFSKEKLKCTRNWVYEELTKHIFFHGCEKYEFFDVFQLAYSFFILKEFFPDFFNKNFSKSMIEYCLSIIFSHQDPKGFWKSDKPLFYYPKAGNAYCHDFEMLVCMLNNFYQNDYNLLIPFRENLIKSLEWIDEHFQVKTGDTIGWSSYHHYDWPRPESWATAAILNFLCLYKEVLTKQMEDEIFDYFKSNKLPLSKGKTLDEIMDSEFDYNGTNSLKNSIKEIISKIKESGRSYGLIFYGPPGSSKTTYAEAITLELEWRYVEINPGKFIEKGLANIEQTTKNIFDKLYLLDKVVILFDEFDELVRDRGDDRGQSEAISRFITTSMLPKIQKLRDKNKNKLFIVATNHLEKFDSAMQRRGRFDYIIPVKYPTYEKKKEHLNKTFISKEIPEKIITKFEKYLEKEFTISPSIEIKDKDTIIETINDGSIKKLLERISYLDFISLIDELIDLLNKNGDLEKDIKKFVNSAYKHNDIRSLPEWEKNSAEIKPRIH